MVIKVRKNPEKLFVYTDGLKTMANNKKLNLSIKTLTSGENMYSIPSRAPSSVIPLKKNAISTT